MAGKANVYEGEILNLLRATNITAPANVYVALFTAAPTDAYTSGVPTGTEVSGAAYARQLCGFGVPAGTPRSTTNAADILFPVQTGSGYGTVLAFAVFDALTAGKLLYWNTMTSKTYGLNDQAVFRASALVVSED